MSRPACVSSREDGFVERLSVVEKEWIRAQSDYRGDNQPDSNAVSRMRGVRNNRKRNENVRIRGRKGARRTGLMSATLRDTRTIETLARTTTWPSAWPAFRL